MNKEKISENKNENAAADISPSVYLSGLCKAINVQMKRLEEEKQRRQRWRRTTSEEKSSLKQQQ